MADISVDKVKQVADMAQLHVTDEEAERFAGQLTSMLDYAEQLNELDTTDVEPTTYVLDMKNVMRKDEPKEWITQEDALKNAPDTKGDYFRVPSILE